MNEDKISQLERLTRLFQQGALSEFEFEEQKKVILSTPEIVSKKSNIQSQPMLSDKTKPVGSGCVPIVALVCGAILLVYIMSGGFDTPTPTKEKSRSEQIDSFFSGYDGSHSELETKIKSVMNDPDSYEHVETRYRDDKETIYVVTKFRGKNGFGGTITQSAQATISSLDGKIIDWKMLD